jgi:hypothetical protein
MMMNPKPSAEILDFYSSPGLMTDPKDFRNILDNLPVEIRALCRIVQNNLIHIFWSDRYGRALSKDEKYTVNVRSISEKLAILHGKDGGALSVTKTIDQKQVGNCRDFTLLLTAILRHQGVAARARCGFGTYFLPDHFEDHWVCEYWNASERRWVLVDPQLDDFQCKELNVVFNPLDVPRDQFIVAGKAWQMCRHGEADPQQFGIFDMHGWWFIWGNVVRELLAFNKIELLPWDVIPGCMTHNLDDPMSAGAELALYDGVASLTLAGDAAFPELRAIYENDPRFRFEL